MTGRYGDEDRPEAQTREARAKAEYLGVIAPVTVIVSGRVALSVTKSANHSIKISKTDSMTAIDEDGSNITPGK